MEDIGDLDVQQKELRIWWDRGTDIDLHPVDTKSQIAQIFLPMVDVW